MLTSMEKADIIAKVESGELTMEMLLDGIASAQYGEDMRKYIFAILLYWVGGGTFRHDELDNRDIANQHPISSITGLEAALKRVFSLSADDAIGIPKNAVINEYFTEGTYTVSSVETAETIKDLPIAVGGRLIVLSSNLIDRIIHFYIANTPDVNIYVRFYNGSTWNEWNLIAYHKDIKSFIYNNRAEENTTPKVMLKYSGSMTSLSNMPADSWTIMTGEEINDSLGEEFPYSISNSRIYKIIRYDWTDKKVSVFEVQSITGLELYVGYMYTGNISDLKWNNLTISDILGKRDVLPEWFENVLITDFSEELADTTEYDGWWLKSGTIEKKEARKHSRLIPVVAGKKYYLGYNNNLSTTGAFFDVNGDWIAPLETLTEYEYHTADGGSGSSKYGPIYTFTAPEGSKYFSYNLTTVANKVYRQFISSSPILALENSGDYGFNDSYPAYQAHKDKKLCVIGASGVALDREIHNISTDPNVEDKQYIVGFQEYLVPWYKLVESYGFADCGYMRNVNDEEKSICKNIIDGIKREKVDEDGYKYEITEKVNFSGYDEFLFIPSTNDLTTSNMGSIYKTDEGKYDENTYFGALNAIIEKIYAESPNAKIYLANAVHKGSYYTDLGTKEMHDILNTRLAELSEYNSLQLIDLASGSGINKFNYGKGKLTYDDVHLNHEGNKWMGLYLRKEMVGI